MWTSEGVLRQQKHSTKTMFILGSIQCNQTVKARKTIVDKSRKCSHRVFTAVGHRTYWWPKNFVRRLDLSNEEQIARYNILHNCNLTKIARHSKEQEVKQIIFGPTMMKYWKKSHSIWELFNTKPTSSQQWRAGRNLLKIWRSKFWWLWNTQMITVTIHIFRSYQP